MRNIKITEIKNSLKVLLIKASFELPGDILDAVKAARSIETSRSAQSMLDMIIENAGIACTEKLPLCQDCGTVYVNIEMGPDVCIVPDNNLPGSSQEKFPGQKNNFIINAISETVSEVYEKYYLRNSIVSDPLYERVNTGNNLPTIINLSLSDKPGFYLEVNLKGGGSENCSWLFMLNPSCGEDDLKNKVVQLVKSNVTKACPPVIIGIGIGATASEAPKLARKAAFRNLEIRNGHSRYACLEKSILEAVNSTGIGPQGLGGKTTALACNIEFAPCHMATLPLSIFFGCHSTRRAGERL
ncbi:MAG: fumarate hydratase [Actinobacteria bacterium]|nr:fumarate hydratase [Actinomycetota bacterium]